MFSVCSHLPGGGRRAGGYPISIPLYIHWSHVLYGGYPSDWSQIPSRGYHSPRWGEDIPSFLGWGVPGPSQGVPQPWQDGVLPHAGQDGVPPFRTVWGPHPTIQDRVRHPLPPGQVMLGQVTAWAVHLLRFPAGELSCLPARSVTHMLWSPESPNCYTDFTITRCANINQKIELSSLISSGC